MSAILSSDDLRLRIEAAYKSWKRARPQGIAVDTETSGVHFYDEPFCVTVAWGNESHYLELGLDSQYIMQMLVETPALVFHNAKFDIQKLQLAGLWTPTEQEIHDTEALAHLVDEHQRLGLKSLSRELLGLETDEEATIGAWFKGKKIKKADRDYRDLPRDILIPYAVKDAEFTLRLFRHLWPQVAAHPDLLSLYKSEIELTLALLDMESHGMAVNVDYLMQTAREYAKRGLELEVNLRELVGDDTFNPNSPKQVMEALNARGHYPESTDADALSAIDDPVAQAIVDIRTVRKIHGTYLLGLLSEQKGGIVHPSFRQHGTRTGRMSSGSVIG